MRRPTAAARGLRTWLGVAVVLVVSGGCFTPPVILETPRGTLDLSLFPAGTELVELTVADDVRLRGVFVPGPPGAPVLLHLMESMATISSGAVPWASVQLGDPPGEQDQPDGYPPEPRSRPSRVQFQVAARCAALGLACLIVDYEGVGVSEGERSPDNLLRDATVAWDEAVRRAGGEPGRVLLRGTSIGALAVAGLLDRGARPAAVTLIAPVRAETVAANFARPGYGVILTSMLDWFVTDAVDVDLVATLGRAEMPLLVVVPERDFLLLEEEVALLREAVTGAGGVVLVRQTGHEMLAIAGRDLLACEVAFYERRVPQLVADREQAAVAAWRAACDAAGAGATGPGAAGPGATGPGATGRGATGSGAVGWEAAAFDEGQPARARLREVLAQAAPPSPGAALAVVVAGVTDEELQPLTDWLSWVPRRLWAESDLAPAVALVTLDDPSGRLRAAFLPDAVLGNVAATDEPVAAALERYARVLDDRASAGQRIFSASMTGQLVVPDPQYVLGTVLRREAARLRGEGGLAPVDADRQVLRLYLKSCGLPDRLDADGAIEVWQGGAWIPLSR